MYPTPTPAKRSWLALAAGMLLACGASAAAPAVVPGDPARTDGDKYHVLLDNPWVRVLAYRDLPGDKTHWHQHPCFVLYALEPFERRLTFPDGTKKSRTFRRGEVAWMPAQAHVGENVGQAPTHALLVELKGACQAR